MESAKTPGSADLRLHDAVLRCLRPAGFSVEMAIHAYSAQDACIFGFALQNHSLGYESREDFAQAAASEPGRSSGGCLTSPAPTPTSPR